MPQTAPDLLTFRLLQVASDPTSTPADRTWSVMVESLWLLIGATPRGLAVRGRLELAYDELTNVGGPRLELVRQAQSQLEGLTDHVALVAGDLLTAYVLVCAERSL